MLPLASVQWLALEVSGFRNMGFFIKFSRGIGKGGYSWGLFFCFSNIFVYSNPGSSQDVGGYALFTGYAMQIKEMKRLSGSSVPARPSFKSMQTALSFSELLVPGFVLHGKFQALINWPH